jgi:hypothetical protein
MSGISEEYRDGECYNCGGGPEDGDHKPIPGLKAPADHPAKPWALWCPKDRQPGGRGYWKPDQTIAVDGAGV